MERRRLIELVFAEIHADRDGVTELVPRDDWRAYMKAIVPTVRSVARRPDVSVAGGVRTPTERKTGLLRARCTPRVVRITERDRIIVEGAAAA